MSGDDTSVLAARWPDKSICPSEIARAAVDNTADDQAWRERMPAVRRVAAERAQAGELVVIQRRKIVDIHRARGAVRIARADSRRR